MWTPGDNNVRVSYKCFVFVDVSQSAVFILAIHHHDFYVDVFRRFCVFCKGDTLRELKI